MDLIHLIYWWNSKFLDCGPDCGTWGRSMAKGGKLLRMEKVTDRKSKNGRWNMVEIYAILYFFSPNCPALVILRNHTKDPSAMALRQWPLECECFGIPL